jgi:peptide chain release factor 2
MTGFIQNDRSHSMEAERLNAIAEKLADLAARGRELRRYL